jgi:hypothetical protein
MIEMKVCKQDVELGGRVVLHRHTERTHPGTGIEDESMTARQAYLHT